MNLVVTPSSSRSYRQGLPTDKRFQRSEQFADRVVKRRPGGGKHNVGITKFLTMG